MAAKQLRDIFERFEKNDGRIELAAVEDDSPRLCINGHSLSVIDALEGTPLVMAEDSSEAMALAERVNERLERMGGASFAQLLDLLLSCAAKRPCYPPVKHSTTPATGMRRRSTTQGIHDLEEDETCAEDDDDAEPAANVSAADDAQDDDDDDDDDEDEEDAYNAFEEEDEGGAPADRHESSASQEMSLAEEVAAVAPASAQAADAAASRKPPGAAEVFSRLQESTHGRAVSLSRRMQVCVQRVVVMGGMHARGERESERESESVRRRRRRRRRRKAHFATLAHKPHRARSSRECI